jgi:hypothetical protein
MRSKAAVGEQKTLVNLPIFHAEPSEEPEARRDLLFKVDAAAHPAVP